MNRKGSVIIVTLLIAVVVFAAIGVWYYSAHKRFSWPTATIKQLGSGRSCDVSEDSRHIGCFEVNGNESREVIDGVAQDWYQNTVSYGLVFSPDGRHSAYWAEKNGKWLVVVDGKANGISYDRPARISFSPDGSMLIYTAGENNQVVIVINGKESSGYENVIIQSPELPEDPYISSFSPDGKRLAYVVKQDGSYYVVEDGKQAGPYTAAPTNLTFSPDSEQLAYIARDSSGQFVVLNGQKLGVTAANIDSRAPLAFSPNSKQFAYINGQNAVVDNGAAGPSYDSIRGIYFSPDNTLVYAAIKSGMIFFVVNGVEQKKYSFNEGNPVVGIGSPVDIGPPIFSPNGRDMAYDVTYYAGDGIESPLYDEAMVVDGKEIFRSSGIGSIRYFRSSLLTSDGHVVFIEGSGSSMSIVIDGEEDNASYSDIWNIGFDTNHRIVTYDAMKIAPHDDYYTGPVSSTYYYIEQPL